MAVKEFERVCKRCSTTWYTPLDLKPVKPHKIRAAKLGSFGNELTQIGGGRGTASYDVRLQTLQDQQARYEASCRCPACGSQQYDERQVKV